MYLQGDLYARTVPLWVQTMGSFISGVMSPHIGPCRRHVLRGLFLLADVSSIIRLNYGYCLSCNLALN